jgi:choline kinase
MKIRKNGKVIELTENELKKIVDKSPNNVDEGIMSSIKGIGGLVRGTGYSYTKYAYEMVGKLKELNEDMEGAMRDLDRILDKSNRSKMVNTSFDRLSTHISDALEAFRISIDTNEIIIQDLDDSVSNNRNQSRSQQNPSSQFNRNNP